MKAPYYESRFIRANHPELAQAFWLRETALLVKGGKTSADVWVMAFDPDGAGNQALKRSHPLRDATFVTDPWTVRIGDTTLDDEHARGSVGESTASRDLAITGRGDPVKVLTERQYASRFPTAKSSVRSPLAQFDGHLRLDGTALAVDGWTGSVNHNWGSRHTPSYAFGQVCGFDGAPSSSLEIVTARAAVGPVSLPAVTLLVFRHGGREFAVRSVLAARRTHGNYAPFRWSFDAEFDDVRLTGEIVADPRAVIGLNYTDTDGAAKYCYNSALATCRIRLSGKGFGDCELTAGKRAMFEILTDRTHPDVPLLA